MIAVVMLLWRDRVASPQAPGGLMFAEGRRASAGPPPAVTGSPLRGRLGPLVDSRTTDVTRRTRDSSESRAGAVLVVSRWLVADRHTGRPGLDPTRGSGMPVQVEGACVDT